MHSASIHSAPDLDAEDIAVSSTAWPLLGEAAVLVGRTVPGNRQTGELLTGMHVTQIVSVEGMVYSSGGVIWDSDPRSF